MTLSDRVDDLAARIAQEFASRQPRGGPDLVSDLKSPLIMAHRGGGKACYPEEGIRGMRAAMDAGFVPEMDVQFLQDGTPVLCHDATVDRTMTGITGNVSDKTLKDWRQARLASPLPGGRDDTPMTLDDVLTKLGGQVLLCIEIKQGATGTQAQTVIDLVRSRGLERAVLMQSFDYSVCQQVAQYGMEVVYLHSANLDVAHEDMKGHGINYWGPNITKVDPVAITWAVSAGIRVVPYTIKTREDATSLSTATFGYFSDDP